MKWKRLVERVLEKTVQKQYYSISSEQKCANLGRIFLVNFWSCSKFSIFSAAFGPLRTHSDLFRRIRTRSDAYGYARMCLAATLAHFGKCRKCQDFWFNFTCFLDVFRGFQMSNFFLRYPQEGAVSKAGRSRVVHQRCHWRLALTLAPALPSLAAPTLCWRHNIIILTLWINVRVDIRLWLF